MVWVPEDELITLPSSLTYDNIGDTPYDTLPPYIYDEEVWIVDGGISSVWNTENELEGTWIPEDEL